MDAPAFAFPTSRPETTLVKLPIESCHHNKGSRSSEACSFYKRHPLKTSGDTKPGERKVPDKQPGDGTKSSSFNVEVIFYLRFNNGKTQRNNQGRKANEEEFFFGREEGSVGGIPRGKVVYLGSSSFLLLPTSFCEQCLGFMKGCLLFY